MKFKRNLFVPSHKEYLNQVDRRVLKRFLVYSFWFTALARV